MHASVVGLEPDRVSVTASTSTTRCVCANAQVRVHISSVNANMEIPNTPFGLPRPCPIMIFEEVGLHPYLFPGAQALQLSQAKDVMRSVYACTGRLVVW